MIPGNQSAPILFTSAGDVRLENPAPRGIESAPWEQRIERMQPVIYRKRHDPMSRGEREWRVENDVLLSVDAGGRERRIAWDEVVSVRLCHEPARGRPWRYVFELQCRDGRKAEIDNAHFLSLGAFEDRSAAFSSFVRAAIARLAAANPKARALIGETPKRYFFLLLTSLLGLVALAIALSVMRTPLDSLPYATPLKLAVILLMLPLFWRWVIGAMPRGVALDAIPDRALPPAPASAIADTEANIS